MEEFAQSSGEYSIVMFPLGSVVTYFTEEKAICIDWALAQILEKVSSNSNPGEKPLYELERMCS